MARKKKRADVMVGIAKERMGPTVEEPDWLKERLKWYSKMKFGLFVHWGIYTQWGCIESWPLVEVDTWARPDKLKAWVERGKDIARFKRDYFKLNTTFDPQAFDPEAWAEAAKYAGMKYLVFTTKHHDGFCMFDSKQTTYRTTHKSCPFHKDANANVAKVVFDTFRAKGFAIGAYFSKSDWHVPYYWKPGKPARTRNPNYSTKRDPKTWAKFQRFVARQIDELMSDYGPIDALWLDGGQVMPPDQDIRMPEIAADARKKQPGLIVVDRTGVVRDIGNPCENLLTPEQFVPDEPLSKAWESCLTMSNSWSYHPGEPYKSTRTCIHLLADVVAKGGNLLLNVGPGPDGRFSPRATYRLQQIGDWMKINGQAIHGSEPIAPYKIGPVCLTRKGKTVFGISLAKSKQEAPPATVVLKKLRPAEGSKVFMLGVKQPLKWQTDDRGVTTIEVPDAVRIKPPCDHAWTVKFAL